jgi:hypothetical protein
MNATTRLATLMLWCVCGASAPAAEWHVSVNGDDAHAGTVAEPVRTIQRAAELAQPGDTITVHAGVYRERVNPPRGGASDKQRITYRAAPGEKVEIKGSEVATGWVREREDVWKLTLPNSFFGDFNPFADLIRGDWFDPRGRQHHTGAVYLNGDWLTEAATLDEVMLPGGAKPAWLVGAPSGYLLNVAWLSPHTDDPGLAKRVDAAGYAAQEGVQNAPCSEGSECIGFIEHGEWVRYDGVEFGSGAESLELRVASASDGGLIEVRLDNAQGELLGTCDVKSTGDWQQWTTLVAKLKPVSGTKNVCLVFKSRKANLAKDRGLNPQLWFAQVDSANTTILAQFAGVDPNQELVEVNVRRTVFYPDQPGRDFITIRGFTMRHAATPWAPPTAEQVGLIGTHWSRGWIIEDNVVSHSVCSGIALGKHGDAFDNTSADTAEGYVKTIERAHAFSIPWTKDRIGHHVVRNNTISHCEQTAIVGSLGSAFCTVTGNTIHDIHIRRLFSGAEMSGIKFHGAIDTTISHNHIYRCCQALWLDWMAQGTRVSCNLFHDNEDRDLFLEVDHGPCLVDNNLFLSPVILLDVSEGSAFVHNLIGGRIISQPEPNRETPFHPAHSTTVAGLIQTRGGDNRFYYNVFVGTGKPDAGATETSAPAAHRVGSGLWVYNDRPLPLHTGGNVYLFGASPYAQEQDALVMTDHNPNLQVVASDLGVEVLFTLPTALAATDLGVITSDKLGTAAVSGQRYENADGSLLRLDTDYFGTPRGSTHLAPGPFEKAAGVVKRKVW